ncbi:hypothetical protein [Cerasicoccus fimbriatus]|uniref:hypothetical protein n=1 Tax=Cerasicoccus fimbriatus TaxID=3014554 RepID=UPI0022B4EEAB|nr:hypothetical protein [Cerasicoccus sp. TK19100]
MKMLKKIVSKARDKVQSAFRKVTDFAKDVKTAVVCIARNHRRKAAFGGLTLGAMSQAAAEVPAELAGIVTDATSAWTSVQTFIVTVAAFMVILGVIMKIRRA